MPQLRPALHHPRRLQTGRARRPARVFAGPRRQRAQGLAQRTHPGGATSRPSSRSVCGGRVAAAFLSFRNNRFIGGSTQLELDDNNAVTIVDNDFLDGSIGVGLDNQQNVTVQDNEFIDHVTGGVFTSDFAADILIADNVFIGTGDGGNNDWVMSITSVSERVELARNLLIDTSVAELLRMDPTSNLGYAAPTITASTSGGPRRRARRRHRAPATVRLRRAW